MYDRQGLQPSKLTALALVLQTLMSKPKWDSDCDEYQAVFSGFKQNWEANKNTEKIPWPERYRALLERMPHFDERGPKPRLPSRTSADDEEQALARRRSVSSAVAPRAFLVLHA